MKQLRCIIKKANEGRYLKGESGFVIYLVLVIVFVIGLYAEIIITSQYSSTVRSRRDIHKLQAYVNAYSGLNLAQAFAAGYDSRGPGWQTQELKRIVGENGLFVISSFHDAGWLRVKSRGIFLKDTIVLNGVLGQKAPSFTDNALNIQSSAADIVITDRAKVMGNIGTTGGKIQIKGSGFFSGSIKNLRNFNYDEKPIENELILAYNYFKERKSGRYIADSQYSTMERHLDFTHNDSVLFIDTSVTLLSDSVDCRGAFFYIRGDLMLGNAACLKNGRGFVLGNIIVKGDARVKHSTLVSFSNMTFCDRAYVRGNIVGADSIVIKDNAYFDYPSFIYLSSNRSFNPAGSGAIVLMGNAVVKGIVATSRFIRSPYNARFMLLGRSRIEGFLMCPSAVSLYGSISGSAFVDRIIYRQERSIYENWLKELSVTYNDISNMTVPLLFPKESVPQYLQIIQAAL
ncbi:MAG: hypothetical protein JW768_14515 [Chitinispirillaceae bacterium]|nr:hypothetical protein [Chitinispirillaceae bacterium]